MGSKKFAPQVTHQRPTWGSNWGGIWPRGKPSAIAESSAICTRHSPLVTFVHPSRGPVPLLQGPWSIHLSDLFFFPTFPFRLSPLTLCCVGGFRLGNKRGVVGGCVCHPFSLPSLLEKKLRRGGGRRGREERGRVGCEARPVMRSLAPREPLPEAFCSPVGVGCWTVKEERKKIKERKQKSSRAQSQRNINVSVLACAANAFANK